MGLGVGLGLGLGLGLGFTSVLAYASKTSKKIVRKRLRRSTRRSRGSGGRKEPSIMAFMAGRKYRPAGARCCDGSIDAHW